MWLTSLDTICQRTTILADLEQKRSILIVERMVPDAATGMIGRIEMDIQVPPTFPERYCDALVRAASQCAVKKHLEHPPVFDVKTVVTAGAS